MHSLAVEIIMDRTPFDGAPDPFAWVVQDLFFAAVACLLAAAVIFALTRFAGFRQRKKVPLPAGFRYLLGSGLGLLLTDVLFVLVLFIDHASSGR